MSNENKKGGDPITSNLDKIRAFDDAYNARDWEVYESFIDESFCNRIMGSTKQQDKAELVRAVQPNKLIYWMTISDIISHPSEAYRKKRSLMRYVVYQASIA